MQKRNLKRVIGIFMAVAIIATLLGAVPFASAATYTVYKDFASTPGAVYEISVCSVSKDFATYVGAAGSEKIFGTNSKAYAGSMWYGANYLVPAGQTTTRVKLVASDVSGSSLFQNFEVKKVSASPTVQTGSATNITTSSATISGSRNNLSTAYTFYSQGIYYSEYANFSEQSTSAGTYVNGLNPTLTGLKENTTYYFRAYVKWCYCGYYGETYGAINSFTTGKTTPPPPPPEPSVTTGTAINIAAYTADIVSNSYSLPPVASAGNLIVNGDFETRTSVYPLARYQTYIGWTVGGNYLEVQTAPFNTSETYFAAGAKGPSYIELNTDLCKPCYIYQDFDTVPGSVLTVKFALSCRNGGPSDVGVKMGVPALDATVASFTKSSGAGTWEYKSFDYTVPAGQTKTRICFVSRNGASGSASDKGNNLDDISVTVKSGGVGYVVSEVGVEYSLSMNLSGAMKVTAPIASPYSVSLSGLTPLTTYFYRAYIIANGQKYIGAIKSFTTLADMSKSINGNVVWNDSNNIRGLRPATFTINLLRDGVVIDNRTINSLGDGLFSFTGLAVNAPNGTPYVYTVAGANPVEGYTTSVNGTTITITNTLKRYYVTTRYINVVTGADLFSESNMVFFGDNFTAHAKAFTGFQLLSPGTISYTYITEDKYPIFYYMPNP